MSATTSISWTDATVNFWWGCEKVSAGCKMCYAERIADDRPATSGLWGKNSKRLIIKGAFELANKLNRQAKREGRHLKVFTNSMADFFEDHPDVVEVRKQAVSLMRQTPALIWQVLTKRPENIIDLAPSLRGIPNVWLGVSVENQATAFRATTIDDAITFISYEPALERVDFDLRGIKWLIFGGESGHGYRKCEIEWAKHAYDQCREAGVAFYCKQDSAFMQGQQGRIPNELWSVKEFPK